MTNEDYAALWRGLCAYVEDELERISWTRNQRARIFNLRREIADRRATFPPGAYDDLSVSVRSSV